MKKSSYAFLAILFVVMAFVGWDLYQRSLPPYQRFFYHRWYYTPAKYQESCKSVLQQRDSLAKILTEATDSVQYFSVLSAAAPIFAKSFSEKIVPFWLGTPYNFYGATQTPGRGTIACGYFVTTVLRDMGQTLDRVALAETTSEKMIRALVSPENVWRFSGKTFDVFLDGARAHGDGLYIVGLDTHTGFLRIAGDTATFIHASGRAPYCVVEIPAHEAVSLVESKYRVLGKVDSDRMFLENWLN